MTDIKFCHYFNNKKDCPYEEIGCMFKHAKSDNCWFKEHCKNKLCQYAHDVEKITNDTTEEVPLEAAESNEDKNTSEKNAISDNLTESDQPKSQPTKPKISCKTCFRWMKDEND